jgi:hypothetical protein
VASERNIEVDQNAAITFLSGGWTMKDIVWRDVAMDDVSREQRSVSFIEVSRERIDLCHKMHSPAIASRRAPRTSSTQENLSMDGP